MRSSLVSRPLELTAQVHSGLLKEVGWGLGSREEDVGLGAEPQFKCDANMGSNRADKEKPEAWALGQALQGSESVWEEGRPEMGQKLGASTSDKVVQTEMEIYSTVWAFKKIWSIIIHTLMFQNGFLRGGDSIH